jgi:hypothetical protein
MEFADAARYYDLPTADPDQPRRGVRPVPLTALLRSRARRARNRRRRLAYLDSTFPWARSGFRYHEAQALLELAPDTLFFSMWEMNDPFPVPVQRLRDFPGIAAEEGVTDAYAVFQLFLAGLAGLNPTGPAPPHFMEGPDLSRELRRAGIRLHGSIYPGGGLTITEAGLAQARALASGLATTFSYVPEVLANVPGVTPVAQAFTETRFYAKSDARWAHTTPTVCLFAADAPPRKGLDVTLRAFADLSPHEFHLHVVGPHEHPSAELPPELATFHGWLSPAELRELHAHSHIFVSPVSSEAPGEEGSFAGVTDGFPTQAAADAMSSGCLLVSANPASDHRVLTPGVNYIDCDADTELLHGALTRVASEPQLMRSVADAGSALVRERMDVRRGAAEKLAHMGIVPSGPATGAAGAS